MISREKKIAARSGFTRIHKFRRGFTMVEVMFIITIIVIILSTVTVALDPLEKQRRSRNVRRIQDLEAIGTAFRLLNHDVANHALLTATDSADFLMMTDGDIDCPPVDSCAPPEATEPTVTFTDCVDISALVTEGYIPKVPLDPKFGADGVTMYVVRWEDDLELVACSPEEQGTDDVLPSIELIL